MIFSIGQTTISAQLPSNLTVQDDVLFYYQLASKHQIHCYALP